MIWSTYHVFGSGCSWIVRFVCPTMTANEYVKFCAEIKPLLLDDGHNGFVGTMSVSDEECLNRGIASFAGFDPGPKPPKSYKDWAKVEGYISHFKKAIEAGFGNLLLNESLKKLKNNENWWV